ncbi:type VII secretion protein EsaA [Metabacillus malikii]|uniref:Type VII secretion EsaA-like protein n=1 Tax=Metabacillus malikii TaxID=1504265 RepID=A0ABT9ZGB5_9BACI|nr:type VII secretion protein EsaA [Metabacillus malikii]MDQ0230842.1 type VII secretion EsaA-like protein [Metabacillus malikii]
MNEKVSAIAKLVIVILLIGITPFLFFRAIGENPLKVATPKETATKTIAIINEDIGTAEAEEEIKLGQDVSSILSKNSNYEWTVVGRSAGENGLRDKKYDAIVYLPSDFTEKIMTYDEENPTKTNLQFKVQSQLNAVNKEKVLVELEKATKRVNQKISTLYWNYISSDLEHVRQEFDEILEKEVAFQQTMTAFYKPSSKDLAGQIEDQKAMLTNLQSSIAQMTEQRPEQKSTMEGYAKSLATFVEYVEQYKQYQEKQQTLLAEVQTKSIETVSKVTQNQHPLFKESTSLFDEHGAGVIKTINNIETNFAGTQQLVEQLENDRFSIVAKQASEYYKLQEKILDFYQQLKDTTFLNDVEDELESLSALLNEPAEEEKPEEPTDEDNSDGDEPAPEENDEGADENDESLLNNEDRDDEANSYTTMQVEQQEEASEEEREVTEDQNPVEQPKSEKPNQSEPPEHEEKPETPEGPGHPEDGENPETPEEHELPEDGENPEIPEQPETSLVDLEKEKKELAEITEEIVKIKEQLTTLLDPTSEDVAMALTGLDTISKRITDLQSDLAEKEKGNNPLEEEIKKLVKEYQALELIWTETLKHKDGYIESLEKEIEELNSSISDLEAEKTDLIDENTEIKKNIEKLVAELDLYKEYEGDIREAIDRKEQSILSSSALSESRKQRITEILSKEIKSKDLLQMMYYYSYLDRYEATLKSMLATNKEKAAVLESVELQQEANKIVEISEEESNKWNQLGEEMPTTQDALMTLEDGFAVFMVDYRKKVDENHRLLLENLDGILQEATEVLNHINQPQRLLTAEEPTSPVEGQQVVTDTERINSQMEAIHTMMDSIKENQGTIVEYTGEMQVRVNDVQVDADKLNNKWASNVKITESIRDDVFSVLGNAFVDGQSNGYVYDFLTNPLKISGDVPEETQTQTVKNLPPVVVMFIVLVCSLLIGYTSFYFQQPPLWVQAILFVLLNIIVGLVISLFGLDIYPLREDSAVQWTVYTIFLLAAGAALIRVAFSVHHLVGIFITVGVIVFYITPLLALTTPNFTFEDPMSSVYMSIQYGTESLFNQAVMILAFMIIGLGALQYFISKAGKVTTEGSETYEA